MIDFIIRFRDEGSAICEFLPPEEPIYAEQLLAAAAKLETYGKHMLVKQLTTAEEAVANKQEKLVIAKPGFGK